jgi:replication initiation and membrane attachment protein DnaB
MLNSPQFDKAMGKKFSVDNSYDIPYVAGYSTGGDTIYFDRHYKPMMGDVDTVPFVTIHERTEKALIQLFGLKYQEAHQIANHVERSAVRRAGIDWAKYEKFVMDQYKDIHHEQLKRVPKDLDLTPYHDEHEYKTMSSLISNGAGH